MNIRAHRATAMRGALVLSLCLFTTAGFAQGGAPFDQLAGKWTGSGILRLSSGSSERIRCQAAYDVLGEQKNLQLNLRCDGDTAKFDLSASLTYAAGVLSGTWNEATRNAGGTLSGKSNGANFSVVAKGPAFTAGLSLVTHGAQQSVTIKSQDKDSAFKGATITLRR